VNSVHVHKEEDENHRTNIAGAGINIAQRVMDCDDASHILLSKHVADDLEQYRQWRPLLHDLGESEVKHGVRLHLVNLCGDGIGDGAMPEKIRCLQPPTGERRTPIQYWPWHAAAAL